MLRRVPTRQLPGPTGLIRPLRALRNVASLEWWGCGLRSPSRTWKIFAIVFGIAAASVPVLAFNAWVKSHGEDEASLTAGLGAGTRRGADRAGDRGHPGPFRPRRRQLQAAAYRGDAPRRLADRSGEGNDADRRQRPDRLQRHRRAGPAAGHRHDRDREPRLHARPGAGGGRALPAGAQNGASGQACNRCARAGEPAAAAGVDPRRAAERLAAADVRRRRADRGSRATAGRSLGAALRPAALAGLWHQRGRFAAAQRPDRKPRQPEPHRRGGDRHGRHRDPAVHVLPSRAQAAPQTDRRPRPGDPRRGIRAVLPAGGRYPDRQAAERRSSGALAQAQWNDPRARGLRRAGGNQRARASISRAR